jgi:vancomycin resistance protein VanJ
MLKFLILLPLKIGRALFWTGLWLFGLSLWVWYPLRWWPGDDLRLVQLLNYFMPWLLVGLIPSIGVAALARRFRLLLTLAIPTLIIVLSYAPLFLPRPRIVAASNTPLKVMSYNVLVINRNIPAMAAVIRQQQPDILLLQELSPHMGRALQDSLADLYPGQGFYFAQDFDTSQAILSRYPLSPVENPLQEGRAQQVRIQTPGGPVQVWNVHLSQPRRWQRHTRQVEALVQAASNVEEPLILGGDFNTTDQSEMYHYLNEHLRNAHWEAGWGFGFTFPASDLTIRRRTIPVPTPLIRIDHLFHNDRFFVKKAGTLPVSGGSDHLPVVAEFLQVK